MPHESLQRVACQPISIHRCEAASQIVKAVDVAELRVLMGASTRKLHSGSFLNLRELVVEEATIPVLREYLGIETGESAQMLDNHGMEIHPRVTPALVVLRSRQCCSRFQIDILAKKGQ